MGGKKAKKGKGKKKKKGAKKGKKAKEVTRLYELPPYVDPKEVTPVVNISARLVNPLGTPLDFSFPMPITTRMCTIKDQIVRQHNGAIDQIQLYLHRYRPEQPVPLIATLEDLGVREAADINIFYDFKPVSHPLLS